MARLDRLDFVSRKMLAGKLKGERRSKRRGQSVEFADYRNYTTGDDLRFIDWNIYARLDKLFLKLFLEEEDLSLYIIVDASASMDYGEPQKFAYARQLAAALSYIALGNQNRLTIAAVTDKGITSTGAMRGRRRLTQAFGFLNDLKPSGGGSFAAATRQFALQNRLKGVCIVLSDFLHKEGVEKSLSYVGTGRYDLFAIQTLCPQEFEPTLAGDFRLVDMEDGDEAEVSITAPLIVRYKSTLSAYCQHVKNYVNRRGGNYLLANTSTPADALVLTYLRQRGLVG